MIYKAFTLLQLFLATVCAMKRPHWHHSRERDAGNYANISPLMDILFRTYRCPPLEPAVLGVNDSLPQSYLGQMVHPFRRRSVAQTAESSLLVRRMPILQCER